MKICSKTLEKLKDIINGDNTAGYRKGSQLVDFFNELGFKDVYGQGFPSRCVYTIDRLQRINGTPALDKCICNAFAVINYIGRISELDALIADFNQYFAFDKWSVVRENDCITFVKHEKVKIPKNENENKTLKEEDFLKETFDIDIDLLGLNTEVTDIIKQRLDEIDICIKNGASLSAVILIGSILEGVLLGTASTYPQLFNMAQSAPKDKDNGKVKRFPDWTLNDFINVAAEVKIVNIDVKKFSHVVRDFRNYIHPYQQMASKFNPDKQTALICYQVIKAGIYQIVEFKKKYNESNK